MKGHMKNKRWESGSPWCEGVIGETAKEKVGCEYQNLDSCYGVSFPRRYLRKCGFLGES